MKHISTTPFGRRPMTCGQLAHSALAEAPAPDETADKWALLKDLTTARAVFGVTDRNLSVLSALMSFLPGQELDDNAGTMVFPSNRSLSDRAHGMPESTLRRHLAALVASGLILRHDSPNGKRYASRGRDGQIDRAFGFDLRPLLVRADEVRAAAMAAREAALRLRRKREEVVLGLRDAAKLIALGRDSVVADWDAFEGRLPEMHRQLRRKATFDQIQSLNKAVQSLIRDIRGHLAARISEETNGNDGQNERHKQSSKQNPSESEKGDENQNAPDDPPPLPLELVIKACPDVTDYVPEGIDHWHELVAAAEFIHPMLGISRDAWAEAKQAMGPESAAITISAILQKGTAVARPGGYLRALSGKAAKGAFSPGPMIMALLRPEPYAAV